MSLRERMAALTTDLAATAAELGRDVRLMEVCGTHTVSAGRAGLPSLMPGRGSLQLVLGIGGLRHGDSSCGEPTTRLHRDHILRASRFGSGGTDTVESSVRRRARWFVLLSR